MKDTRQMLHLQITHANGSACFCLVLPLCDVFQREKVCSELGPLEICAFTYNSLQFPTTVGYTNNVFIQVLLYEKLKTLKSENFYERLLFNFLHFSYK